MYEPRPISIEKDPCRTWVANLPTIAKTEFRLANCSPSGSSQLVLPNLAARRIGRVWSETGAMLPMTWHQEVRHGAMEQFFFG